MFKKQFLKVQENYENKISELSILKELANTLRFTNFQDMAEFFWKQLNIIQKYVPLKNIALMLLNDKTDDLEVIAETRYAGPIDPMRHLPFDENPAMQVVSEGHPVLVQPPNENSGGSKLFVPILHNDQVIGVLELVSDKTKTFNQNQMRFFSLVADQIATQVVLFRIHRQMLREEKQRLTLSRFFSNTVAEKISGAGEDLQLGGERREVTILFADLHGFTTISEGLDQEEVVAILNTYFSIATPILFHHDATLDKLMGDGILAFFGAPLSHDDDVVRAVKAAIEIVIALQAFNLSRSQKHWPQLDVSIGINTGEVVAGYIGSEEHLNYTVIGDAVNVAQRLQSIAEINSIYISKAVHDQIDDKLSRDHGVAAVTPMAPQKLKGKETPTDIYRIDVIRG